MIKEGIALFGARAFPLKELIASLGPVLNGNNGPAREIALSLMVELTRWIGIDLLLMFPCRSHLWSIFHREGTIQ